MATRKGIMSCFAMVVGNTLRGETPTWDRRVFRPWRRRRRGTLYTDGTFMGGRSIVLCSRGHISWFIINVDDFSRRLKSN